MTVVNPKSISGITSITTASGSDNLLTIHTSDASSTERVRINSSGDVIVGSGITVSPDGDIFTTGVTTTGSLVSSGAISGTTGTFTSHVSLGDSDELRLGAGNDLKVYHDGNSKIQNTNDSCDFRIQSNSVEIKPNTTDHLMAKFTSGGSADLYYNNGKTFETKDIGVIINNPTGSGNRVFDIKNPSNDYAFISLNDQNTTDNSKVRIGALANEMLLYSGAGEVMRLSDDGKIGFNNTDPSAAIEVTFDSGGSAPSSGTAPEGIAISYGGSDGKNGGIWFSPGFGDDQGISGISGNRTSGYQTDLRFYTNNTNSARAFSERMRILPDGRIMTNGLDGNTDITTTGTGDTYDGMQLGVPPFRVTRTSNVTSYLNRNGSQGHIIQFRYGGNLVGSISDNSNNLPSDRNYKKNITNLSLGLDLVNKLQPVSYHYKFHEDTSPVMYGLIAQDVEIALNDAGVAQNKAAILQYEEKNDEKQSDYNLDYGKLTPILINAVKELSAEIESLKSEIAALKSS